MTWMSEYEIEEAVEDWGGHPVLGPATRTVYNLMRATNQNSDGWAYWKLPARAADELMQLIVHDGNQVARRGEEPHVTLAQVQEAYKPIRKFKRDHPRIEFYIDEGHKQIVTVTTVCMARVQEEWKYRVPIDWTLAQVQEAFHGEDDPGPGMELVSVRNVNIDHEHDREVVAVEEN